MKESVLAITSLRKTYKSRGIETKALNGVNMDVLDGEFVSVMGPSGSGKTTLLNILSTIDQATSGSVSFKGTELAKMKKKDLSAFRSEHIGYLFQEYNLLDHLTVFENVALPMTFDNQPFRVVKEKVDELLNFFGIEDHSKKYPYELSGGQKQRVAAARAIIKKPSIVLADEPTGALDSKSSLELLNLLMRLNKEMNITILMVTHDPLSASYSQRVVFLKDGKEHSVLYKEDGRRGFYHEILDQLAYLGGNQHEID